MRTKQALTNDLFWAIHAEQRALTRKEISRLLGYRSKSMSPHLILIIEGLVAEGFLIKVEVPLANKIKQFKYFTNQLEAENLLGQL